MRNWILRGGALVLGSTVAALLATRPAAGDEANGASKYEATPALYGAVELGLGGRPLYQSLFPNGWPTTKDFRRATLDASEGAFVDNVAGIMGSGLGVPLTVSTGMRNRLAEVGKLDAKAPTSLLAFLKDRYELFRHESGLAQAVDDKFVPVFLPFRRGEPIVNGFDEARPGTWAWSSKNTEATVTLDSVGFAIYANTLLADQELSAERKVDKGSGSETFVGHSDYSGFAAFCALDCAVAGLNELREKLCLDLRGAAPAMDKFLKAYNKDSESARKTFYPHTVVPKVQPASVQYEAGGGKDVGKSYLWDQAALLLGVCELAKVSDSKTGAGRFFANDKKPSYDPDTSTKATELAVFIFETMYGRHVNRDGRPSSFATVEDFSPNLRIQDAGLLLLALESFLELNPKNSSALEALQKKEAKNLLNQVAKFVVDVQKISKIKPGFNDAYTLDVGKESATDGNAALATQGLAIRGLVAAKRAYALPVFAAAGATRPDCLGAAQATVTYLEKSRWDGDRRAYVDTPGPREKAKVSALDAFAVLGGLRDLALDQKDVRYLLRYKSYLSTVRAGGLQLAASSRENDADGVKKAAAVGLSPVITSEITLP